jgi:serine protease Do
MSGCSPAAPTPSPTASAEPSGPATSAPPSAVATDGLEVDSIGALPGAVIQVEATGVFREPGIGAYEAASRGSGFIIDPSGIAVTNNHVVTGATKLTVWVGQERVEHAATVLGASECSDLAVIQIDGLSGSPYLSWYEGEITPGLDIYAAGFPLGDPEFTLTKGIVSRAHGLLDENWAWVEASIEHDANTNPGSSGGPVVTVDGRVVGVHYAGDSETVQHWAISRDGAVDVIATLREGRDVASIGVNGTATADLDTPGIWASSIREGSPADRAGIVPGDVITKLDGQELAVDGTMKEYCQVLRDHAGDDVLPFEIYRESDDDTLEGELNGTPIEPGFSFTAALDAATPAPDDELVFDFLFRASAGFSFDAPITWADIVDATWTVAGDDVGQSVLVAEDVAAFKSGWTTPGMFVAVSESLAGTNDAVDTRLDADRPKFERTCTNAGRRSFARGGYAGSYDLWQSCAGTDTRFVTVAAEREDAASFVYVQFQAVTDADVAALDRLFTTLDTGLATP